MKIAPGTPLDVSLHWDADDIQPVGKLAYRDRVAYLDYDEGFLKTGLELSPVHHKTGAGLQRPYRGNAFEGLHGVFNDSLPDGWGRLLVDRRARQLGIDPATLTRHLIAWHALAPAGSARCVMRHRRNFGEPAIRISTSTNWRPMPGWCLKAT